MTLMGGIDLSYLEMHDKTKLYYLVEGEGSPIIFVHGWRASADAFADACRYLKDDYLCIRYDQRGHLRSETPRQMPTMKDLADDLKEIIETQCKEKPVLVGWSMGGGVVLEYIQRYGCSEINGIAIIDKSPWMLNDENWKYGRNNGMYTRKDMKQDVAEIRNDLKEFLYRVYETRLSYYSSLPEAEKRQLVEERAKGYSPPVLASLWESLVLTDYRGMLAQITVPTAIFHAGINPSCPSGAAVFYVDHVAGPVKTVFFEDASHDLVMEKPKRFATELNEFINHIAR